MPERRTTLLALPLSPSLPLLLLLAGACSSPRAPAGAASDADRVAIDAALMGAARFLVGKQSPDGAFRSETYSAFADGRALTPVVAKVLFYGPPVRGADRALRRASDFVATLVKPDGSLDEGEYGLDYPVYTLSMSIVALSLPANGRHAKARDALMTALEARQLAEPLGWSAADTAYGGWGYHRGLPRKPARGPADELSTSNLTSTLFATGALAMGGRYLDAPAFARARGFVLRCQNYAERPGPADDGGFIHTPTDAVPNKAGPFAGQDGRFRSYGTTTADGLRALMRLGVPRDDPRLLAAERWLLERFDGQRVPGDYPPDQEVFRASGYHYWTWTAAHALMLLGPAALGHPRTRDWPRQIARALVARQRSDGSWRSAATDQREDDPLIATSLSAAALAVCRVVLSGGVQGAAAAR
jgi:squalene-hopene/tetraprenyl-beta-curcumene cyclase